MKSLGSLICSLAFLLLACSTSFAQTPVLNKFYDQHKTQKGAINFTLPSWLFRLGGDLAKQQIEDDPEAKAALKLMKKVKNGRFLIIEDMEEPIPAKSFDKMVKKLKKRNRFNDLIMVKTGPTRVNFMIRENRKGDLIKNLLILVNEGDTFVMASLKTKLKYEEITEFVNEVMKATKEEEIVNDPPVKKPEPKVKPQA